MKLQADYIKHSLSPLDFYTHELSKITLNKHGWNDGGNCPFHNDNCPGSFHVNIETGAYKCFSCGAVGGDVIAYKMMLYDLTFIDALNQLVNDWGL